jgi:4-amino-4-deoxy-L-arabinose transferase-like glycosyltransferase
MTSVAGLKTRLRPQYFIVLTFAVMLIASWQRWTSLIVDIGRETDLPFRILNGEMLYRDVHYIYPPLSPYFNAFLFKVFGAHLDTLSYSGIFFAILLTFLCYRIARKIMPATEASVAVSFIIVLCFFKPAGNLILSYSFAGVHAAVFSLTTVLFTMRYAECRNRRDLVMVGIFIGLATISKQEFAFAGAVTVTAYLIYLHRSNLKRLVPDLAFVAGPAIVIALPVFAVLFANIDARTLIDDCHLFYTNMPESLVFYNRFRSGLNYPGASFIQMIGAAALCVAVAAAIMFFSDRTGTLRSKVLRYFAVSAVIVGVVLYFYISEWDGSPLRALPFFLVAVIVYEWMLGSRGRSPENTATETGANPLLFIVAVYSLAILLRAVLRVPSGGFSGSFYLPTSLILIFYALLNLLPNAVRRWTGDEGSFSRARRITTSVCIIAIVATGASFAYRFRQKYNRPITAPRGTLFADKTSGPAIDRAMKFIEANTSERDFIAIVPEGCDIAFLTGRRINFRHQVLIPGFLSQQDELDAIAALMRDNVRFIFVPNRPMMEFGSLEFGKDFYQTLGNYIEENYQVVEIFGLSGDQQPVVGQLPFFIKAYKKKGV